jgi:hypothetical protein
MRLRAKILRLGAITLYTLLLPPRPTHSSLVYAMSCSGGQGEEEGEEDVTSGHTGSEW